MTTWPGLLTALMAGHDLSGDECRWAMNEIMSGSASPVHVGSFLVALRVKGETVQELRGLADEMLRHAVEVAIPGRKVDLVGTGGDMARTVNISTMAAMVVAAAGIQVVKHGNRATTSSSGSADVMEALGLHLDLPVPAVARIAADVGITFCFAQTFHPAMRFVSPIRKELSVVTAFNFLGPLANPAGVDATAIGVSDPRMAPLVAGVLADRGTDALVFRGADGLDELTTTAPARIWHVEGGQVETDSWDFAELLHLPHASIEDLRGGNPAENALVVREVLAGRTGPVRDAVLLNAAAALVADGTTAGTGPAAGDLAERMRAGFERGAAVIDSGDAARLLDRWIAAAAAARV